MHHRFYLAPSHEQAGGEAANCRGWHRPAKFEQSWAAKSGAWGAWDMGRDGVCERTNAAIPVGLFWVPASDLRRMDQGFERRGVQRPEKETRRNWWAEEECINWDFLRNLG
jgi:hypothetical protein